jgi:hypothetical protein
MELAALNLSSLPHQESSPFLRRGVAVCYQCSFTGVEAAAACPDCDFPLIMQSDLSPPGGIRVSDVLQRESLRLGAPPLPGVHAEPRKAQLLQEARKRIRDTRRLAAQAQQEEDSAEATRSRRGSFWGLISVSCVAVGFGIVAAALQNVL